MNRTRDRHTTFRFHTSRLPKGELADPREHSMAYAHDHKRKLIGSLTMLI
jgi:hypothetical protein